MTSDKSPKLTSYEDAAAFLLSITDNERRLDSPTLTYTTRDFDILRFRQGLATVGDPQGRFAVVHVAGTKGKGSTCAMVDSALRGAGLKVGLYTSPHLRRFTERIRIDGQEISGEGFAGLIEELAEAGLGDRGGAAGFRTVFEMLTAAAFVAFARANVDVAVVETGLGGRLDSTNVFEGGGKFPQVSVITSIGFDHTAILGNTIEAIAGEKAGIVHGHAPCVLAVQPAEWAAEVRRVVAGRVQEVGGALLAVDDLLDWQPGAGETTAYKLTDAGRKAFNDPPVEGGLSAGLWSGLDLHLPLPGRHQQGNAAAALVALLTLEKSGQLSRPLVPAKVVEGVEATCWPGRVEVVAAEPVVIIDGAHCPMSVQALAEVVATRYPGKRVHLVCGFLRDKNIQTMLSVGAAKMNVGTVAITSPGGPRAMPALETEVIVRDVFQPEVESTSITGERDIASAVASAMGKAREGGGIVVIFGSLYLVEDARAAVATALEAHR